MKKGFAFIEFLVVVAIVSILVFAFGASIHQGLKCRENPQKDGCPKVKVTSSNVDSHIADKFDRNDVPGFPDLNSPNDFNPYSVEPTDEQLCDGDSDCLKQRYNSRMIDECVQRYQD